MSPIVANLTLAEWLADFGAQRVTVRRRIGGGRRIVLTVWQGIAMADPDSPDNTADNHQSEEYP